MANISVKASSSSSFTFANTLLTQLEVEDILASGKIKPDKAYRYWQVVIPQNIACAEIVFLDQQKEYIRGKVTDTIYTAGFDNNPLTNLKNHMHKTPVIDFGKPVQLSKIIVLPRSDGNSIYPKNEYELFYYTLNGWTSLGRQIADDYCLNFYNIPRGALYWLHNWTSGMEERIFTINENDEIQFW
ncbi:MULTISPECIES: discoidin domain-containing protein [Butyricimonas]|uniref:discoidin domain-containing protein n=1 Tax=Butyricimonas TaxID=574697 RepID=UPI000A57957F|nr:MULTISPECIES: discoidin domain-containing protein [Butyricimonas]